MRINILEAVMGTWNVYRYGTMTEASAAIKNYGRANEVITYLILLFFS